MSVLMVRVICAVFFVYSLFDCQSRGRENRPKPLQFSVGCGPTKSGGGGEFGGRRQELWVSVWTRWSEGRPTWRPARWPPRFAFSIRFGFTCPLISADLRPSFSIQDSRLLYRRLIVHPPFKILCPLQQRLSTFLEKSCNEKHLRHVAIICAEKSTVSQHFLMNCTSLYFITEMLFFFAVSVFAFFVFFYLFQRLLNYKNEAYLFLTFLYLQHFLTPPVFFYPAGGRDSDYRRRWCAPKWTPRSRLWAPHFTGPHFSPLLHFPTRASRPLGQQESPTRPAQPLPNRTPIAEF